MTRNIKNRTSEHRNELYNQYSQARDRAYRARMHPVRPSTPWRLPNRTTKADLASERLDAIPTDHWRPETRADCARVQRPCCHVRCKYNLYLDTSEHGNIKLNFPDLEPYQMEHSCALDIADTGGTTLVEVGLMLNITRERARQVETLAMLNIEESLRKTPGILPEHHDPAEPVTAESIKKRWRDSEATAAKAAQKEKSSS